MYLLSRPDTLRRVAFAALVANIAIVVSGGAVRLTGSGLGCPTWPGCTDDSYVPTPAAGIHMAIEYGNRVFSVTVGLITALVLLCALLQRPRRPRVTRLSILALAGIPAQAVVGGLAVLTDLNPWVVGCHFLVSMGVIAAAYACWHATREGDGPATPTMPRPLRQLVATIVAASGLVVLAGVVVTGSGPHAGDEQAKRTGLNPEMVAQAHADLVFLLLGLVVAAWFAVAATTNRGEPAAVNDRAARTALTWLLAVILGQGVIGFVQYATNLPALLVGAHMLGACLVWVAALALWFTTRRRGAIDGLALMVELAAARPARATTAPNSVG